MKSILLVDDESDLLAAWHLILTSEGYDVRCAANGAEALESMRQRVPDLVITDWMMPLMGGAELSPCACAAAPGSRAHPRPYIGSAPEE
ncbi:Regulator of RpoS [Paraburkholderia nemoris]|uniref:response regulator transcription factor n=1 Tax=Paraburkholderia nemoris TaxID=2793076 RepID=UPI001B296CD1|nr:MULTISPECIES: response regulator [Paraburkholderia]CAE6815779.1 Regulator of RpoS [Paraburkholderia nemoris]